MTSLPLSHLLRRAFVAALLLAPLAVPAQPSEQPLKSFQLRDGSVISGRLVSVESGHFLIENATLGRIRVPENDILSMTTAGSTPPAASQAAPASGGSAFGGSLGREIEATQTQILANPALLAEVQALAQDPQVAALTSDPAFINALLSGNLQSIQNNPRTQQLMSNPKVQALIAKLMAARGQQ